MVSLFSTKELSLGSRFEYAMPRPTIERRPNSGLQLSKRSLCSTFAAEA